MRDDNAVALLAEHPQIFVPKVKETGFFAFAFDYGWKWYAEFFETAGQTQLRGEGSTFYSTAEQAEVSSARIVRAYPDARFIFMVRDPLMRLESSFREYHHGSQEFGVDTPYDIVAALSMFPNLINDTLYWQHLCAYRKRVPDSHILVVFLEDLEAYNRPLNCALFSVPRRSTQRCRSRTSIGDSIPLGRNTMIPGS